MSKHSADYTPDGVFDPPTLGPLEEDEDGTPRIRITVLGGVVQNIERTCGVPQGLIVELVDFDTMGLTDDEIREGLKDGSFLVDASDNTICTHSEW